MRTNEEMIAAVVRQEETTWINPWLLPFATTNATCDDRGRGTALGAVRPVHPKVLAGDGADQRADRISADSHSPGAKEAGGAV